MNYDAMRRTAPITTPSPAQLAHALKRTTTLLESAQRALTDPVARRDAIAQVQQSNALLKRFEGKR